MGKSSGVIQEPPSHSSTRTRSPVSLRAAGIASDRPFSKSFWDNDAGMIKAREIYFKFLAQRVAILLVVVFTVFALYWASSWRLPVRSLDTWIVDFDGQEIGRFVSQQLTNISRQGLTWRVRPASAFPNGESDLVAAVLDEKCWAAVSIAAGSTARLNASLTLDRSYDPSSAIIFYASEARNENAYRNLLRPIIESHLNTITHTFAVQFASNVLHQTNGPVTIAPETLVRPLYYTLNNLRPFDTSIAGAVIFSGLIYLLILSFIVADSAISARVHSGLERSLTLGSLLSLRLLTPILIYLIISVFYTLLSLAFGLPLQRQFGHSGFVIFWMISWFGMTASGLALESTITLLTDTAMQIFLMLWIIGNVAVCLWPIEALPKVFIYGYASPFYNISRAVRAIALDGKNQLALNFGVLTVWICLSCITLPMVQWYRRRQSIEEMLGDSQDSENLEADMDEEKQPNLGFS